MATQADPPRSVIELDRVSRSFGPVRAVDEATLSIGEGVVHAVVGENGAGKSTLGKVIAGVHGPSSGTLRMDGREVRFGSPREAIARGVAIIAQEIMLAPDLTVMENVFLGRESRRAGFLRDSLLRERYDELAASTGFAIPANARVRDLRLADQQIVEIMRAMARDARLIVMDEPTAALSRDQAERLLSIIDGFRRRGVAIVFVSHFLDDVLAISDVITVMRDGRIVSTRPASEHTESSLVGEMLGAPADVTFGGRSRVSPSAPVVAEFRNITRLPAVEDVSISIRAGEIVGLAGLVGSGRTEFARVVFGADRGEGGVAVQGREVRLRTPRDAIRAGMGMVPESRKDEGLTLSRPILENVSLAALNRLSRRGYVRRTRERAAVAEALDSVRIGRHRLTDLVSSLSGGNQQKALFARWVLLRPRILIVDEPTRGIDINARRAIYELLHRLAEEGMAILMISSDMSEILHVPHRIVVLRGGRVSGEFDAESVAEQDVMNAIFDLPPVAGAEREPSDVS